MIAINADGESNYEIKLTYKKEFFKDQLLKLLKSDFLGCKGKILGISSEGQIIGWAFNPQQKREIDIWLQSNEAKPIKVKCNLSLYKLPFNDFNENYLQLPLNCGVNFNLSDFPNKINIY